MNRFSLSFEKFELLVKIATRHHLKQIAAMANLRAHSRRGVPYFKNGNGTISHQELHRACDADPNTQRQIYNLYMHYAHFGRG